MRSLLVLLMLASGAGADDPLAVERPSAFKGLINPNCSHCIEESLRRKADLRDDDPVLEWTRGYSDGGAIPVRFFLAPYRVISDSYGVFVYDPDAGYARGFAPSYTFRFHGWRNGILTLKDEADGTLYSALSGVAFAGPRKGERLRNVPTLTGTWGEVMKRNPNAVAYQMFDKYKPQELPNEANADSVKTRGKLDDRLPAEERILGVRFGDRAKAYALTMLAEPLFDEGRIITKHAAFLPKATAPRKYVMPRPDPKTGVSPPNPGTPIGGVERPARDVTLKVVGGILTDTATGTTWDIAGRGQTGELKGWTLEPLESVACKWFAWSAEYPKTDLYADAKAKARQIAGASEFLRLLPKPWATLKSVDAAARTVTLLLDGETEAKVWPLTPDAELRVNAYWGRLEQFQPGQRVWAWLKLDRAKKPVAVAMLADELSEWEFHASYKKDAPPKFPDLEVKRREQAAWLSKRWDADGLPGSLSFAHVFSGEVEIMLDHEAIRRGRMLASGDVVHITADPPIRAVVKHVQPWRERTQVRLVVGELAAADLQLGQRLSLRVPEAAFDPDAAYPPDIDRPRPKAERVEWFLASTYCVCGVGRDICTGMYYTLASCNPNGCAAPNDLRAELAAKIDAGASDRQIWDHLLKERGPRMLRPHLRP